MKISSSSWYDYLKRDPNKKKKHKGRKPPGFSKDIYGNKIYDEEIISLIKTYKEKEFFVSEGGYRIFKKYLFRDYKIIVNPKKLYRLLREKNILLSLRRKRKNKFKKISKNRKVLNINQVWEFDIKYGYIHGENRFFFLLAFVDVFTREIKSWQVSSSCKASELVSTLQSALKNTTIPKEHKIVLRSDNGSQMTSHAFKNFINHLPVEHEFIPVRTPNKNAHIESFFSIVDRHLQDAYFLNFKEAYTWMIRFMDFYNKERIHGSLGMSPIEFSKRIDLHKERRFMQSI